MCYCFTCSNAGHTYRRRGPQVSSIDATSDIHGRPLCTYVCSRGVFAEVLHLVCAQNTIPGVGVRIIRRYEAVRMYVWYRRACSLSPVINSVVLVVRGRNSRYVDLRTQCHVLHVVFAIYICVGMPSLAVRLCLPLQS